MEASRLTRLPSTTIAAFDVESANSQSGSTVRMIVARSPVDGKDYWLVECEGTHWHRAIDGPSGRIVRTLRVVDCGCHGDGSCGDPDALRSVGLLPACDGSGRRIEQP